MKRKKENMERAVTVWDVSYISIRGKCL